MERIVVFPAPDGVNHHLLCYRSAIHDRTAYQTKEIKQPVSLQEVINEKSQFGSFAYPCLLRHFARLGMCISVPPRSPKNGATVWTAGIGPVLWPPPNIHYEGSAATGFFDELKVGDLDENAFVRLTTAGKGDAAGDQCEWQLKSETEIFSNKIIMK
jgi:hypothetical protein